MSVRRLAALSLRAGIAGAAWGFAPSGTRAADPPAPPQIAEDTVVSSRSSLVETLTEGDHLLGDWGGWRTWLVERGVHFQAGYIGEVVGNMAGGLKRGVVYEGLFEAALGLDFEKLTQTWKGASFRASLLYPHGANPSQELVGDLQGVSNIEAYDSVGLYELWLEQNFWKNRVSVRIGQQLADQEFTTTASGALFLNSSFGWPAFLSGNTLNTGPAYYRAALGARLRIEPHETIYLQTGIYDGDTFDDPAGDPSSNPHGANFCLNANQGAFIISEIGWRLNQQPKAEGLAGAYKLGGWVHTGGFADITNPAMTESPNYGVYLSLDQNLWREARSEQGFDQGLSAFFRAGFSPQNVNQYPFTFDTGFSYTGLIPGRDEDTLGIGFAYVMISDDIRKVEEASGASVISDYELAFEVTYEFLLTPSCSLQPDFQWIHHPGGSAALDDAFVAALRFRLTF